MVIYHLDLKGIFMTFSDKLMGIWVNFLQGFLPNRFKRMIFLSSFMAYIQGTTSPDKELICKLNQLLKLSSSDSSVMVPPLLNQRIWAGIVSRDEPLGRTGVVLSQLAEVQDYKMFTGQARSVSDRIIKNTPSWLKYGSNNQIRNDLTILLTNVNRLANPA